MAEKLLYKNIVAKLLKRIDAGELRNGDKVPSIALLCREFECSPVTAVHALHELSDAGVLDKLPGRGYFVAQSYGNIKHNLCIGCLLRANFVSSYDQYFNEIVRGIQQGAALQKVDLLWSHLALQLSGLQVNLRHEVVESALEMNDRVAGFLVDERIQDATILEIQQATGKPVVLINRPSRLPITSISPDFRESFYRLMDTLLQMQYNRFIFAASDDPSNYSSLFKRKIFEELIKRHELAQDHYRILPRTSVVSREETIERFHRLQQEIAPGKLVIVSACDFAARLLLDDLLARNFKLPGEIGLVTSVGLSSTLVNRPRISTLKIDTVQLGECALNSLIEEISRGSFSSGKSKLLLPDFVLGETL